METVYRRRAAGKGRRVAGRSPSRGTSDREQRRLLQLCISVSLFLVVYFGQGVLPRQAAAWKAILTADMNLGEAVSALRDTAVKGGTPDQVVDAFWDTLNGIAVETQTDEGAGGEGKADAVIELSLPDYHQRPAITELGLSARRLSHGPEEEVPPAGGEEGAGADESVSPADEPVVTAVAQTHTEDGQALPANVSLRYYNLGLSETALPVEGQITSDFDFRDHPINETYSFHTALDIGAPMGDEIRAFAAGKVEFVGENSVAGLYIQLDHGNGVKTFYAHCSEVLARKGETVDCGEVVALVGDTGEATGPHLHFVIEKDGIRLNPAPYLGLT